MFSGHERLFVHVPSCSAIECCHGVFLLDGIVIMHAEMSIVITTCTMIVNVKM